MWTTTRLNERSKSHQRRRSLPRPPSAHWVRRKHRPSGRRNIQDYLQDQGVLREDRTSNLLSLGRGTDSTVPMCYNQTDSYTADPIHHSESARALPYPFAGQPVLFHNLSRELGSIPDITAGWSYIYRMDGRVSRSAEPCSKDRGRQQTIYRVYPRAMGEWVNRQQR